MTYEELKNRLSKCELSLEKIKNGTINLSNTKDIVGKKEKLEILKESLTIQIKEAEETMFVSTKGGDTKAVKMTNKSAMDLKSDPNITSIDTAKGKTIKERLKDNKGVEFSVEETKSIARSVGKAVASSLKSLGDEVAHMKAKNIEENSFEIYVEYKNDSSDEFSFYITDDSLHLVDFTFDKELTDVGVKPSGEAVVNVDVLANELTKHFKSMNESEVEGDQDGDDEALSPEELANKHAGSPMREAPEGMYYIKIPKDAASQNKAQVIFNDIYDIDYEINDDPNGIVMYFKKEKFNPGLLDDLEGDMVKILDTNIPNINEDAEEDAKNDADYEAGWHDDPRKDEDVDVGHQDDEPDMLQSTAYETAQYAAKLVKKLQKYDQFDGEVDFPNWWQSKLILAKDYMQKAYHYLDSEEKQPAIDQLALEGDGMSTKIKPSKGDPTNMAYTDKVNERLDGDQQSALMDLQNILDQAAQLGDEARSIIQDTFPEELRGAEAYDVFNFGSSSNSYDNTLESLISDIERRFSEDEGDDLDEGRSLSDIQADIEKVKKLAPHMNKLPQDDPKRKGFIAKVEKLNQEKKDYEAGLHSKVKKTGADQEVSENEIEDAGDRIDKGHEAYQDIRALIQKHARKLNDDDAYTMHELLKDFFNRLLEGKYKSDAQRKAIYATKAEKNEAGPGFKHDCAAKVIHKEHGAGTCIPEKHTLVKEGTKYVVTHYDVLFESGKTVEDIPVSELDVKTSNEHWHKGYKKKKK